MKHLDGSKMKSYVFQIPSHEISIQLPIAESADFPKIAIHRVVDTSKIAAWDSGNSILIADKYFDYRSGALGATAGTLSVKVRLRKSPEEYALDLRNIENLQQLIAKQLHDSFDKLDEVAAKNASSTRAVRLPKEFQQVITRGAVGFKYELGGAYDYVAYIFPISSSTYVQVQFNFIDNSHGKSSHWRKIAGQDMDAYAQSISIK
jgi:hypothetical protein